MRRRFAISMIAAIVLFALIAAWKVDAINSEYERNTRQLQRVLKHPPHVN